MKRSGHMAEERSSRAKATGRKTSERRRSEGLSSVGVQRSKEENAGRRELGLRGA